MRYFEHESGSMDDEKMTKLYIKFGYEGVGLFFAVLEKLTKQEKPIDTEVLKKQLHVGKKLEKCWQFMESLEILSSNNGQTFNKRLTNFIESVKEKREKTKKRISEYRDIQQDVKNVTEYKDDCTNEDKIRLDKIRLEKIRLEDSIKPQTPFQGVGLKTENFDLPEKKETPKKSTRGAAARMAEYREWLNELGFKEGPATDLVLEWLEYKTGRREYYSSPKTLSVFIENLRKLSGGDYNNAKTIVRTAIGNTSQGIYPLKNSNQNGNSKGTKVTNEDLASIILGDRFVPGDS